MKQYLEATKKDCLTLSADGSRILQLHVDASFAVHPDIKIYTGVNLTMGKGTITHLSRRQIMNTGSTMEAQLVDTDDAIGPMLWTRRFLEYQTR